MAKRDVDQLIREAAAVLDEAMGEAAAIAVVAVEKYGASLRPFCRDTAAKAGMPGAAEALRSRTMRLQKGRSKAPDAGSRTLSDSERAHLRGARAAIRKDPNAIYDLLKDPAVNEAATDAVLTGAGQTAPRGGGDPYHGERRDLDVTDLLNRVALACERAIKRLPDYVPGDDDRDEAKRVAEWTDAASDFLRDWARGRNIADEVASYLGGAQ